eukprot:Nk52_evm21s2391 gene=Nk52_evmTU21s2391
MNTKESQVIGWAFFTGVTLSGLYWARKDLQERRDEQEKKGVRSSKILTWQERVAVEEERIKASTSNEGSKITIDSNAKSRL